MRRNKRGMRLGTTIALYTFLFGTIIGVGLTLSFSQTTRNSLMAQAEITLTQQAHQAAQFVDALLSSKIQIAETIAANQDLALACATSNAEFAALSDEARTATIQELNTRWQNTASVDDPFIAQYLGNDAALCLLRQTEVHPGEFGEIFLTDRFGALVSTTGKLTTLAHGHKPWWLAAYNEGQGAVFLDDRGYDLSVGDYVLGVVVPVISDGEVVGILKCNYSILLGIGKAITVSDHALDAEIMLARSNGLIVYGQGREPLQSAISDELTALMSESESGWTTISENGSTQLAAFWEVSSTAVSSSGTFGGTAETIDHSFGNSGESWVIVVSQDMDLAMAPARLATLRIALLAAGSVFAIALVSLVLGLHLAQPIRKLATQAQALRSRHMDVRMTIPAGSEISKLAQSFNEMADHLETTMVSRDELSEEVDRRKLVEAVLKASESQYRQLATYSPDVIWTADLEGRFTYVSPSVEQLRGYTPEEVMQAPMSAAFTPESMEKATAALQQLRDLAARGESFTLEKEFVFEQPCKDGSTVWTETAMTAMHDNAGGFIGILGISRDITERKKMEDALQESEAHYRSLFENMINGFALHEIVLDEEGRPVDYIYLEANSAFEKLTGLDRHQIIGKKVTEVLPGIENDTANWIDKYGEIALTGSEIRFEQYSETLDKWFSILAFSPSEGQFATIFEDITDRKSAEEKRKALEAHLRQNQKLESIGTLASGVAHEINNPLMGIINYADLISIKVENETAKEYSQIIMKEGNRIAEIVRNLLSFSRQDKETYSPAEIRDIVDRSLSLVGSTMRKDQITVDLDIPDNLPAVKCRSQQIQQVVINLLTNAHAALNERYPEYDENKLIRITVRPFEKDGEDWIRTTVEDHGVGIPEDLTQRIFDPFFSTKSRHEGTGLGLSVSFGIVQEHHGELTVESVPGEHTRFHMDLRVNNGWSHEKSQE